MDPLKRRRIGVAYERAPYEKLFDWIKINMLRLIGAAVGFFLWSGVVIVLCKIINFVATGGGGDAVVVDDTSPFWVLVKIVGGVIVALLIVLSSKR